MGATYINLQVNTPSESILETLIPKGYVTAQTAMQWVSVYEENRSFEWNKLCRLGKKISRECKICVIAAGLFDEDEFFMELYKEGKTVGYYRVNLSESFSKGSAKWIEELNLSKEEAGAFRYLLKKELAPSESVYVFSRLLGVKLFAGLEIPEENTDLWRKDAESVIEEIQEEKKRTKIKNRTKVKLIQEIPGLYESCDEREGIIRMVYPDGNGDFAYGHIHCLEICEDGFWEIHDYKYPPNIFGKNCGKLWMDYEWNQVRVNELGTYCGYEYDLRVHEKELNALMEVPQKKKRRKNGLPKINPVYSDKAIDEGHYEFGEWRSDSGFEVLLRKVDLETSGKTFAEKNVVAVYEYEPADRNTAFWQGYGRTPVITENGVVNVRLKYLRGTDNAICDIRFFDKNLRLLRKEEMELKNVRNGSNNSAYCEKRDYVFWDNRRIDLRSHEIKEGIRELEDANKIFLEYNKADEGCLYAIQGSTVYVFDLELNLKSCHRLKGRILFFYKNARGNICLITGRDVLDEGTRNAGTAVRIYEIEW